MRDAREISVDFNEPVHICGRFTGAGAGAPTPVANVPGAQSTKATVTYNSTGNIYVTLLDPPLGVVQSYDFWIGSPANNKNVQVAPPAAGSYQFKLLVTYHANGVAVDVASSEELVMDIWTARTAKP